MADLGILIRIQATGADNVEAKIKRVSASADDLERRSNEAGKKVDSLGRSLDHAGKSAHRASEYMNIAGKAIAGVVTIQAIRKIFDIGDNYRAMSERVRMATSSLGEFHYVQERLMRSVNVSYRSLSEAQEMFIMTSGNLRDMGYSLSQALDITDSLSFAFVRNATSAQRAEYAINSYDRALSKGVMNGEQWRVFSGAVETVAKNIGDVYGKTALEIDRMGHDGLLTIEMINEGLRQSLNENRVVADSMFNSLNDAATRFGNAFNVKWGEVNESLEITSTLASGIILIADNLEYALIPALGLGAIGAGKLTSSALLSANSFRAATLESFRYQTALAKMTGVSKLAAQSMVTTSIAARGLSSAMSFLGGPVGILSTVVAGLSIYSLSTKDAALDTRELESRVHNLSESIEGMTANIAAAAKIELMKDFLAVQKEVDQLEYDLERATRGIEQVTHRLNNQQMSPATYRGHIEALERLKTEQTILRGELDRTDRTLGLIGNTLSDLSVKAETAGGHLFAMGAWSEIIGFNSLIKGGADQQAIFNTNTQELSNILKNVEEQYRNIGLTTSQITLNRALELDIGLKEFALLKQMLDAIDGAPKIGGSGKTSLNYYDDALKNLNNELITTKTLTDDLLMFGDPSQYTAFREMNMELNDTKGVLASLLPAQKAVLEMKAKELDSQKQINAILTLGRDKSKELDDLEFEISLWGKSQKEIERLTYFRNLDNDAHLISIGMTEENIGALSRLIEKMRERYLLMEESKEIQENSIGAGLEAGMQQYIDNIGNMRDQFAGATESVLGHMEGFLVDFAHTGKLNFRDMTTSILQDISKMMIQMAMMQAVTGMQGWFKGLGWFSSGGSVPTQAWSGGLIPEYATGGRVIDFSGGGFTGMGGMFEPKGIVHGGEYVMSKAAVNNLGVGYFEQLHDLAKSGRGFASGGSVGSSSIPPAYMVGNVPNNQRPAQQSQPSGDIVINQTINYQSSNNGEEDGKNAGREFAKGFKTEVKRILADEQRAGGMLYRR